MGYIVDISREAETDILSYKIAGNKVAIKRIKRIIDELKEHPEIGIGNPEKLTQLFRFLGT